METMELDVEALQLLDDDRQGPLMCFETCAMSCMASSTYISCNFTGGWT